jgi:GNAT superfamily N-acetyltransferase
MRAMSFRLRAAAPEDVPDLLRLIRALAEYERLTHLLEVTPEALAQHLFGERPAAEAWVAELTDGGDPAVPGRRDEGGPHDDAVAGAPRAGLSGDRRGAVVGFALFFTNFSTFLGRPGLYLEDLYVEPAQRGRGIGKALLRALGRLALERGCGRFEWSVLDWNADAIGFYRAMGAKLLPDWRLCRVAGEALRRFAD